MSMLALVQLHNQRGYHPTSYDYVHEPDYTIGEENTRMRVFHGSHPNPRDYRFIRYAETQQN